MSRYKVYRTKENTYNPHWLSFIERTKSGYDRKDWATFILAWKASIEDDYALLEKLEVEWKKRRPKIKELERMAREWKLTFNPVIGTGRGLARSERQFFSKIKKVLRSRGEGKVCWACGITPQVGVVGPDVHEFWDFDFKHRIRSLKSVYFLCTDCHYLVHRGNAIFLPVPTEDTIRLVELFCRVNNCKIIEAYSYLTTRGLGGDPDDVEIWEIDLSHCDVPLT